MTCYKCNGKAEEGRGGEQKLQRYVPGILFFDILNGAATLDATNRKASGIGKTTNYSRLPLERALKRLVDLGGVFQVDDVDVAVGGANDE